MTMVKNKKVLSIFDLDLTLFMTTAHVNVKNSITGQIKRLSNQEFNDYKLDDNEYG
jgi:hypothetical protein